MMMESGRLGLLVMATAQRDATLSFVGRDATLSFVGWTSNGLTVSGNAHWYRTDADLYFWAGATTVPVPAM
jgi:hypothetical protein